MKYKVVIFSLILFFTGLTAMAQDAPMLSNKSLKEKFEDRIERLRKTLESAYEYQQLDPGFVMMLGTVDAESMTETSWLKFLIAFETTLSQLEGSSGIKGQLREMIGDINSLIAQAENNDDRELVDLIQVTNFSQTTIMSPNEFLRLIQQYAFRDAESELVSGEEKPKIRAYLAADQNIDDSLALALDIKIEEIRALVESATGEEVTDREFLEMLESLGFENTSDNTWRQFIDLLATKSGDFESSLSQNIKLFREIVRDMEEILRKAEVEDNRELIAIVDQTEFENTSDMSPEEFEDIILKMMSGMRDRAGLAEETSTANLKYFKSQSGTTKSATLSDFDEKIDELKELVNAVASRNSDREFIDMISGLDFENVEEKNWRYFVDAINEKTAYKEGSESQNVQQFRKVVAELNELIREADNSGDREFVDIIDATEFAQTNIMSPAAYRQLISDAVAVNEEVIVSNEEETAPVEEETAPIEEVVESTPPPATYSGTEFEIVTFDYKSSELSSSATQYLDNIVSRLQASPGMSIIIQSHTDNVGGELYNRKLSLARAINVEKYLVANGVARNRIKIQAFGEEQIIIQSDSKEGNSQNRRVEFVVSGQ